MISKVHYSDDFEYLSYKKIPFEWWLSRADIACGTDLRYEGVIYQDTNDWPVTDAEPLVTCKNCIRILKSRILKKDLSTQSTSNGVRDD